ncbi:c-type cytochrome biogenesis protein CcmI/CycH [Rhodoferax mekongensis]|uniref:c-type cytochrome biogenesis protein CcmI/CycH n=1 Tax=Rhodoferax mekongensis TaxID=3068341 RepID=UPI0028BE2A12|nr:tetratricopeptide repeat protein [Rhodoferax sp. TBRC 17199]MDT7517045.1 tetratricopeptide repeat protein [Rhodoferax sp. TBRC 17199]
MTESVPTLKKQLLQLRELHVAGVISTDQFDAARAPLERRIVDELLLSTAEEQTAVSAAPGTPEGPTFKGKMPLVLAGVVLLIAAAGYAWKGTPAQLMAAPVASNAANAGDPASPHSTSSDQIAAMADKLAARMESNPDDAEGWAMLARSYSVLGRYKDAEGAYRKATGLRQDDAALWTDYADALAMNQGGRLQGEPIALVRKALKLDASHVKALSLAGTYAYDQKQYAEAVKYWEQVVQKGNADDPIVKQSASALEEARGLAGMPAKPVVPSPADSSSSVSAGASVSGLVKLDPQIAKLVSPTDTVFVFARSADPAQRMPLAILKKQVQDLPLRFTLDDSLAMQPGNALSSQKTVVVSARISKSGNAMPQAGDYAVQSKVVSLGAADVALEIRELVKP